MTARSLERRLRRGKGCYASWLLDLIRNPLLRVLAETLTDDLLMICSLVYARRGLGFSSPFPSGYRAQGGLRVLLEETGDAGSGWKT